MTTNADAIAALVRSKSALQDQCDAASGATLAQLTVSIHNISGEIGALETAALDNATYIPATDVFKSATDDAKDFLATLDGLKSTFGTIAAVARALDTVVRLITKLSA